jgi:hypothetical protein
MPDVLDQKTVGASLLAMAFFQALGFFGLGYISVASGAAAGGFA